MVYCEGDRLGSPSCPSRSSATCNLLCCNYFIGAPIFDILCRGMLIPFMNLIDMDTRSSGAIAKRKINHCCMHLRYCWIRDIDINRIPRIRIQLELLNAAEGSIKSDIILLVSLFFLVTCSTLIRSYLSSTRTRAAPLAMRMYAGLALPAAEACL